MHSENSKMVQKPEPRTFIEEARRTQIIDAAIQVLSEDGYADTSLAKIAKKCGLSTSSTLYHFKDKRSLMLATLQGVESSWQSYVQEKLAKAETVQQRLHTFIEANLAFMGTRPKHFSAFIELSFNARDLNLDFQEDPSLNYLQNLFTEGQEKGICKNFDPAMMALTVRGAIDQYLGLATMSECFELEAYTNHVIAIFDDAVMKKEIP